MVSCLGTESTRLTNKRSADARIAVDGFESCAKLTRPMRH